jgi:hypothetical protein
MYPNACALLLKQNGARKKVTLHPPFKNNTGTVLNPDFDLNRKMSLFLTDPNWLLLLTTI